MHTYGEKHRKGWIRPGGRERRKSNFSNRMRKRSKACYGLANLILPREAYNSWQM